MSDDYMLSREHLCARQGKLCEIQHFLFRDGNPNSRDEEGSTCLMWAAWGGHVEMMKVLLNYGANVNLRNVVGSTALHFSVQSENIAETELLLLRNVDLNIVDEQEGTPLHYTAKQGNADLLRKLVEKGADIDCQNINGMTPLHVATCHQNCEMMEELLEKGADINKVDLEGRTALHYACLFLNKDSIKILVKFKADATVLDHDNQTAVMLVSQASSVVDFEHRKSILRILSDCYFQNIKIEGSFFSNQSLTGYKKSKSLTSSSNLKKEIQSKRSTSLLSEFSEFGSCSAETSKCKKCNFFNNFQIRFPFRRKSRSSSLSQLKKCIKPIKIKVKIESNFENFRSFESKRNFCSETIKTRSLESEDLC
mmetsp:Transcript_2823/g.4235  ORF Transcript_2823/g.4235 Transcript_2823/m.4235 type:complete len:367 (+) Transcript_2823:140-1240(+)